MSLRCSFTFREREGTRKAMRSKVRRASGAHWKWIVSLCWRLEKPGGDSKKAHIKQKIVCHHHLHPSTTEAKYKYTIEPIYRTRLNSDASTGLKVCFYCFQRIWPSTLRNDRGYTWSHQPFPPRHCVPCLGATQRHNRQCFSKCVSVNKSCKVCIFPPLALKQTAHEFFQKGLWLMIRRSYIWWTLYWGLFYYFKEK